MLFFTKLESTENFAINNFAPVFDWFFFLLDDSGHVVRVSNDFFRLPFFVGRIQKSTSMTLSFSGRGLLGSCRAVTHRLLTGRDKRAAEDEIHRSWGQTHAQVYIGSVDSFLVPTLLTFSLRPVLYIHTESG